MFTYAKNTYANSIFVICFVIRCGCTKLLLWLLNLDYCNKEVYSHNCMTDCLSVCLTGCDKLFTVCYIILMCILKKKDQQWFYLFCDFALGNVS